MKKTNSEYEDRKSRCRALRRAILVLLVALAVYLYWVQVSEHEMLAKRSEHQQSRLSYLPARRGAVLDRNGTILNGSTPQYDIAIHLDKIRDPRDRREETLNKTQSAIAELSVFLGPDYYLFRPARQEIEEHIRRNAPLPLVLWSNVDLEVAERLSAELSRFPYAELVMTWCREYYHGNAGAHVRGFVRRADARKKLSNLGINRMMNVFDVEGASGIEELFNTMLEGQSGYQKIHTDVLSYRSNVVETQAPVMGKNVQLTIDIELQEKAEELLLLEGTPGATVMLDVRTGEILVLASCPSYHLPPLKEDSKLSGAYTNRATMGYFPPGSTMKPFIAMAALEQGVITPEETVHCPGYYELANGRRIKCSSKYGHGSLNVTRALAVSCNTFFCVVGARMQEKGYNALAGNPMFNQFFGRKTNMLGGRMEIEGIFYTPEWVKLHRNNPYWDIGDSIHAAIGQGEWIVTPLQMAVYACAITTGRLYQVKLVKDGSPAAWTRLRWEDNAWNSVLQGLSECIQAPYGTGRRLGLEGINAYGKTGTAEHISGKKPHAWMFVVAPADSPRIAVACVLEEGGHGGEKVAPILGKLLNFYFKHK